MYVQYSPWNLPPCLNKYANITVEMNNKYISSNPEHVILPSDLNNIILRPSVNHKIVYEFTTRKYIFCMNSDFFFANMIFFKNICLRIWQGSWWWQGNQELRVPASLSAYAFSPLCRRPGVPWYHLFFRCQTWELEILLPPLPLLLLASSKEYSFHFFYFTRFPFASMNLAY